MPSTFTAAEFFAGIGLVRLALSRAGIAVAWANDIDPAKRTIYAENFGGQDFWLRDIRGVQGREIPAVDLATASFPCTDLSLAGGRAGLRGEQSSMFWQFARVLGEMATRPRAVLIENVPGLATSHAGRDLEAALEALNGLGYWCDLFTVDARHFVPQSRPRLFIVGTLGPLQIPDDRCVSELRPVWIHRFTIAHPRLLMQMAPLPPLPTPKETLDTVIERLDSHDEHWWNGDRLSRFIDSLSPIQLDRLARLRSHPDLQWRTAYRRTRHGLPVWEIRHDAIAGCLRTARGGSSKQAVVEAGLGSVRVRWMTPREYAALQGAAEIRIDGVTDNQALFGFGDAVCVPVITWIAQSYLRPILTGAMPLRQPLYATS